MSEKQLLAFCFSLVLLASGCKQNRAIEPDTPPHTITVCSGCGSEWQSYGPGKPAPITKCPNCPMTEEEFEALKEQVRKRLEEDRKAKEGGER